jgi:outer membrane protein OmpA-like peptidoglycan-associated protein
MKDDQKIFSIAGALPVLGLVFLAQGCLATRDWVKEQMDPVSARVSQSEKRINQTDSQIGTLGGRVTGIEGNIGQIDGRLGQVDSKAEKALSGLANLRLERKLVIDFKEGANFAFDKAALGADAKKEIDSFLSDTKGDLASSEGSIFLVAGHTDNVGPQEYNYDLGRRRAEGVARYLITQKQIDPLHVATVSYGKDNPVTDNNTPQGRAKNRRVEILVYRDALTSTPSTAAAPTPLADAGNVRSAGDAMTQGN